jgi:hypothetical protein
MIKKCVKRKRGRNSKKAITNYKRKFTRIPKVNLKVGLKHGFRSGLEETVAKDLEDRNIDYSYESLKISYTIPTSNHTYTIDFELHVNGIIIETKGRFTVQDRKKHLLIKHQHPEYDIRFVFSNSKCKIRKGSKTTYGMWCDKNGFKYADKKIPEEWLLEK